MAVIPGSHKLDQMPHRDTFDRHNLLTRGQEIAVEVDASQSVPLNLRPGEMSLHHVRLVHGSAPNPSLDRRIGFAIRYIPTSIRQLEGEDSATLVRGEDRFHYFEHEPSPRIDMDPALLELHRQIPARYARLLALKLQEDCGIDIVSDGEQSRQHFVHGFLEGVDGIDFARRVPMGIRNNRYEAMVPTVTGPLRRKGPVHAAEARIARAH